MNSKIKLLVFLLFLALLLLAWAPWLNDKALHDKVFEKRAHLDGTIDKQTGELICDYSVTWVPFGRFVASCEGGYFVTFFGAVLL